MLVQTATLKHISAINQLANQIWWHTYGNILPVQQIAFMLADMYSPVALQTQMDNGHSFKTISLQNKICGFASYSQTTNKKIYKIQKIYIHQQYHGLGLGKMLINFLENEIFLLGASRITLNVNRENPAQHFYLKMGYFKTDTVNIPYFNFVLNDYVMQKHKPKKIKT